MNVIKFFSFVKIGHSHLNYPSLKEGDSCFTDKRLEHEFLGLTPSPRASHPVVPTVGRFLFRQIQCITIFFKRQYFLFSPKGVALHPLPEERGFTATFDKRSFCPFQRIDLPQQRICSQSTMFHFLTGASSRNHFPSLSFIFRPFLLRELLAMFLRQVYVKKFDC